MTRVFIISIALLFISTLIFSQDFTSYAEHNSINKTYHEVLSEGFTDYKVVKLDASSIYERLKSFDNSFQLSIEVDGNEKWDIDVAPEFGLIDDMRVTSSTGSSYKNQSVVPYKGFTLNQANTEVRLTSSENVIYMMLKTPTQERYIEPLRFIIPGVESDLYIVYNNTDVIYPEGNFCGSTQKSKKINQIDNSLKSVSVVGECFEVELAQASDFSMYQKYNSDIDDVTAHNVGVMNNVQTNYDDEFADELQFAIVAQYISDCSTCDPWTSNTDPEVLLPDFRGWGNDGNFGAVYDIAHLWTNRDFDESTIGLAYVGVVCGFSRYSVLQDFTSNAAFLRVLVAHETGHNFNADHDGAGTNFIMAPSVNSSTTWSSTSINVIESHYNSRTCLDDCPAAAPPESGFSANLTELCPGTTIQFTDETLNSPDTWSWSFPGGNPSSSSDQNPFVSYDVAGTYSVTLTTTNESGTDTEIKTNYIVVGSGGFEFLLSDDFTSGLSNWTVTNPDNSNTWETAVVSGSSGSDQVAFMDNYNYNGGFGDLDGLESPVLDLSGRTSAYIEMEYAYARFDANNSDIFRIKVSTNGGNSFPFTVFTGQENGSGSFATVSDQNGAFVPSDASEWCIGTFFGPDCINVDLSAFVGESNVVVLLENESDFGNNLYLDNVNIVGSCQSLEPPVVNFSASITEGCAPLTVDFQDLSTNNPDNWQWFFPGGTPTSSTEQNPTVVYQNAGEFDVTLIASNEIGSNTLMNSDFIVVDDVPTADFDFSEVGLGIQFENNSIGADFYQWTFGDGDNSTQENPFHIYENDGEYEVELLVGNECGNVTVTETVVISSSPTAGFSLSQSEGCADFVVNFTNMSSNNAEDFAWTFPGGNPESSTEENPVVTYTERGVYDVSLVVTNEAGSDEEVLNDAVTVNDVPIVDFSTFINENTVDFSNLTQFGDSYSWDFGDSESSNMENPSHTYSEDGEYEVTLEAENACGTTLISQTVVISNLPNAGAMADQTSGCTVFTVQFSDNSSDNVDSWLWTFEGGNPSSSTDENPVVQYANVGVYSVTLVVTNEEGSDELLLENYITVQEEPEADFSFSTNMNMYSFTSESSGADTYLWDFGDGETSTLENPTHTYDEDGMYTVLLSVTNACGTDQFSMIVQAVSAVSAGFTSSGTSGCASYTVQFTNGSSANVTDYLWTFPGGNPASSTLENPVVIYEQAGLYDVTLEVSNSTFSDEISFTNYVNVQDVPNTNFEFDVNQQTVNFQNTTTDGITYFWDFGDGETSIEVNPIHVYDSEGEYTVTLVATNSCGSDTTVIVVNVSSLPTANFSSNSQNGCAVVQIQYENLSTSNVDTWLWTFEGGNPETSTNENPLITYSTAGVFDVSLTVTNESGQDTYTLTDYITVSSTPIVTTEQTVIDNTVELEAISTNADSYLWTNMTTGETFSGQSPTIEFPRDGIYQIQLSASNECGTTTIITAVNITAYPDALFEIKSAEKCAEAEVVFEDLSMDNPTEWEWNFEGGTPTTSSEQNPLVIYNTPGVYTVELIVTNDVGNDTLEMINVVEIAEKPQADFDFTITGPTVEFTNTSIGDGNVQWNFGDGEMSSEENPIHVFEEAGTYSVMLIIDNGGNCTDTLVQTITTDVSGINDINGLSWGIFPNPARDYFDVTLESTGRRTLEFMVINTLGQVIIAEEWKVSGGSNTKKIDTRIPSGMYFVNLLENGKIQTKKIVIE